MVKYFTDMAEDELMRAWVQDPMTYVSTPFASFEDLGREFVEIIFLPCRLFTLTTVTLVEALMSPMYSLYFYCRQESDLATGNWTEGWSCAAIALKTLGLWLVSLLYSLVFVLRLFQTFLDAFSNDNHRYVSFVETRAHQRGVLARDNSSVLSEVVRRYGELVKKTSDDKKPLHKIDGVLIRKYTTHLPPAMIKAVKQRALDTDRKDYEIMFDAINKYFSET